MRSLKIRFLVTTLPVVLLGLAISGVVSYKLAADALDEASVESCHAELNSIHNVIDIWVDGLRTQVEGISERKVLATALREGYVGQNARRVATTSLAAVIANRPIIARFLLINANGDTVAATSEKSVGKNYQSREYFQKAIAGQTHITEALISKTDGKPMFVIAAPVKNKGKTVGALACVVSIEAFVQRFVDPIKIGKTGYPFIVDAKGLMLAHPDKNLVAKFNIVDGYSIGQSIVSENSGSYFHNVDGEEMLCVFDKSDITGWIIAVTIPEKEIHAATRKLGRYSLGISALVILLLAAALVFNVTWGISRPANNLARVAAEIAGGNLDATLVVNRKDEIGELQKSLVTMVERLRVMIRESDDKAHEAAMESGKARQAMDEAEQARKEAELAKREGALHAASTLEAIVESITSAVAQLSDHVEESQNGAQRQRERTTESATAMEQMSASVLEVARNANQASDSALQAKTKAEEGGVIMSEVVKSIEHLNNVSEKLQVELDGLGSQAESIGQVMAVINDIADQTNLLALNAAIEAARAGDAGRGFAVVADEVRKLAEKTMTATREVGASIAAIQSGSQKSIHSMRQTTEVVEHSTRLVDKGGASLKEIVGIVEFTADQVHSIATASEEQSAAAEQITRGTDEISIIASETADTMNKSSQAMTNLSELSGQLRNLISDLKSDNA